MRPVRVNVEGGWYHVTSRGLNRAELFVDARDREQRLELLGALPERFGVIVHAYVLMTNHDHFVLESPRGNVSAAMQWLNVSYGVWFNRRHGRLGPVFARPFKAVLVDGDGGWALELSRYVHLNPVRVRGLGQSKADRRVERAGLAGAATPEMIRERLRVLRAYRWSSYGAYAGYGPRPEWLTCAELWRRAGRRGEIGTKAYRRYVERYVRQGEEEEFWGRLHAGMALGGAEFVERMRKLVSGDPREQPAVRQWRTAPEFEAVVAGMERVKGERWSAFRDRRGDPGRDLVLWLARRRCGLTLRQLGEAAGGVDYLAVSKAVARIDRRLRDDRELAHLRACLERELSNV